MKPSNPKEIIYQGKVLAVFYPKQMKVDGIRFLTPSHYPLQVGLIAHPAGKKVVPHIHRDLFYDVNTTQEFIYIEKGKNVKITVYTKKWKKVKTLSLSSGDSILFVSGGHGLDIPPRCRLFEIKQGPYPGDSYAKIFKN